MNLISKVNKNNRVIYEKFSKNSTFKKIILSYEAYLEWADHIPSMQIRKRLDSATSNHRVKETYIK